MMSDITNPAGYLSVQVIPIQFTHTYTLVTKCLMYFKNHDIDTELKTDKNVTKLQFPN